MTQTGVMVVCGCPVFLLTARFDISRNKESVRVWILCKEFGFWTSDSAKSGGYGRERARMRRQKKAVPGRGDCSAGLRGYRRAPARYMPVSCHTRALCARNGMERTWKHSHTVRRNAEEERSEPGSQNRNQEKTCQQNVRCGSRGMTPNGGWPDYFQSFIQNHW